MAQQDSSHEDKEFEAIARAEAERKRSAGLKFLAGLVVVGLLFGGILSMLGGDPGLKIDIESGEKDVLSETNDPDCRAMIVRVEALKKELVKAEVEIEAKLLSKDEAEVAKARVLLKSLRASFASELEKSEGAALRSFPDSEPRKDLQNWFAYVDTELAILDRVAEDHLVTLRPPEEGVEVKLKKKKIRNSKKKQPKKTLPERRDAAMLAMFDAFENFRVWHTAGFHPCGKAEEGETPWTPPAGEEKAKGDEKKAAQAP